MLHHATAVTAVRVLDASAVLCNAVLISILSYCASLPDALYR